MVMLAASIFRVRLPFCHWYLVLCGRIDITRTLSCGAISRDRPPFWLDFWDVRLRSITRIPSCGMLSRVRPLLVGFLGYPAPSFHSKRILRGKKIKTRYHLKEGHSEGAHIACGRVSRPDLLQTHKTIFLRIHSFDYFFPCIFWMDFWEVVKEANTSW